MRTSDVYTRLNTKQFITMLPDAGEENIPAIIDRIRGIYVRRYHGRTPKFSFAWFRLEKPVEKVLK